MAPLRKKQAKKKKKKEQLPVDLEEREARARRVKENQERRQRVIKEVIESLKKRRAIRAVVLDKLAERETRILMKESKDSERTDSEKMMAKIRADLGSIIAGGILNIDPNIVLPKKIKWDGRGGLTIFGTKYKVKNNLHIVGWGREAVIMSSSFERVVGKQLKKGMIVVPSNSKALMWAFPEGYPRLDTRISFIEAGADDGQPDGREVLAAQKILHYCKKLKKNDILIVVVSTGIDDLLCCPRDQLTLNNKLRVLKRLQEANGTAAEVNTVRNKLSAIRGGDLARAAFPAKVVVLVTSDVSPEQSNLIAGGPCNYDPKDNAAQMILMKYNLLGRVSQTVRELVQAPAPVDPADQQLTEENTYKFVTRYVIACNIDAMDSMAVKAAHLGFASIKFQSDCRGSVELFGEEFALLTALTILANEDKINKLELYDRMSSSAICPLSEQKVCEIFSSKEKCGSGMCLMMGGRPDFEVSSESSVGGPNQELALYFAISWYRKTLEFPILKSYTVWILATNSQGKDGNTGSMGAYGYKNLSTEVVPAYQKYKKLYRSAFLRWWKLNDEWRFGEVYERAKEEMKELEDTMNKYGEVLPDRILREHDTNCFFKKVNNGDELYELPIGNYFTEINIGSMYVIRIMRYQCSCVGLCQVQKTCTDKQCIVNRDFRSELIPSQPKDKQFCCHFGSSKVK